MVISLAHLRNLVNSSYIVFLESAKLRAMSAIRAYVFCVLSCFACLCALRASKICVPCVLTCLRAYVLKCFACLRALRAPKICVLTCFACLASLESRPSIKCCKLITIIQPNRLIAKIF